MKKSLAALIALISLFLFGCVPQRSPLPPAPDAATTAAIAAPVPSISEALPSQAESPLPTAEPVSNALSIPAEWKEAFTAEGPEDLNLDGSLSWIWTKDMNSLGQLAAMHSMCAAATGRYNGRDCVYAGQVHRSWDTPIYTANDEYPNIQSVSGSDFSVYFVEHNDVGWRLIYLPLDSKPDQAAVVDEGAGMAPVLSAYTGTTLAYAMRENDAWFIRVREKMPAEAYTKAAEAGAPIGKLLADIPLEGEPLEANRSYMHNAERGVTYTRVDSGAYSIMTRDTEGESAVFSINEKPILAQANDWCLAWMDDNGNLFAYVFETGERTLLGTEVSWFDVNRDILFADQNASRLVFAGRMEENNGIAVLPIAAGNYAYTACTTFTAGETYALVLRERDGAVEFAGMDLMLRHAE